MRHSRASGAKGYSELPAQAGVEAARRVWLRTGDKKALRRSLLDILRLLETPRKEQATLEMTGKSVAELISIASGKELTTGNGAPTHDGCGAAPLISLRRVGT